MTLPGLSMWNGSSKFLFFIDFWHYVCWRLWRPWMLPLTKYKGHKSNAISLKTCWKPLTILEFIRTYSNIGLNMYFITLCPGWPCNRNYIFYEKLKFLIKFPFFLGTWSFGRCLFRSERFQALSSTWGWTEAGNRGRHLQRSDILRRPQKFEKFSHFVLTTK